VIQDSALAFAQSWWVLTRQTYSAGVVEFARSASEMIAWTVEVKGGVLGLRLRLGVPEPESERWPEPEPAGAGEHLVQGLV
jgi:hypothetical protein